jgi:hypothetical protein
VSQNRYGVIKDEREGHRTSQNSRGNMQNVIEHHRRKQVSQTEGYRTGRVEDGRKQNIPAQLDGVIRNLMEVSRTFQPSHLSHIEPNRTT